MVPTFAVFMRKVGQTLSVKETSLQRDLNAQNVPNCPNTTTHQVTDTLLCDNTIWQELTLLDPDGPSMQTIFVA